MKLLNISKWNLLKHGRCVTVLQNVDAVGDNFGDGNTHQTSIFNDRQQFICHERNADSIFDICSSNSYIKPIADQDEKQNHKLSDQPLEASPTFKRTRFRLRGVVFTLEHEQLPKLEAHLKNNDGSSFVIQQRQLKKMKEELEELQRQEDMQFTLLEKGKYTEDVFDRRNKALHAEMDALKTRIFETQKTLPKDVDYQQKIMKLNEAISALKNDSIPIAAKNKLLKSIVKRIDYEYQGWEGKGKVCYTLHIQLLI